MCIGLPCLVTRANGYRAWCDDAAAGESIDLALVGAVVPGDWLLVHAGVAVRKLDAAEARLILDALEGARRALTGEDFEYLFADLVGREPPLPEHLRAEWRAAP